MSPPPFLSRYFVTWLASQTVSRAQNVVLEEAKARLESGDLGAYEGILFKDAIKPIDPASRITAGGVELGVVGATKRELVGVLDRMTRVSTSIANDFVYRVGLFDDWAVAVVETGEGADRARRGTEALLQAFRPAKVVALGFAKPLDPDLKNLALFAPNALAGEDGSRVDLNDLFADAKEEGDAEESTPAEATNPIAELLSCFATGALASVDVAELDQDRAERLKSEFGARAYDRNTRAVVDVCVETKVPVLPLEAIFEFDRRAASPEVALLMKDGQSAARKLGAFFGATFKQPRATLDVFKVKNEALEAADKLAKALSLIVSVAKKTRR